MYRNILTNKGIGLVAAIFVISIMAMFGLLIARYVSTGATSSLDDYQWAQALYSAEAGAKLKVLFDDQGGGGESSYPGFPTVAGFTTSGYTPFTVPGTPSTLETRATHPTLNISRTITIKYIL